MNKYLSLIFTFAVTIFSHQAAAYTSERVEEACKKPKFTSFSLAEYKAPDKQEVAPEAEFTFVLSNWIDPASIKMTAKHKPIAFTVENKNSFFLVKSKIPAEYTGQFVRLDVMVNALLGCRGLHGWLVKVANKQ